LKPMHKWTFSRNDGGAYLLCDGVEVAHVPNMFSSEAANHGIPLGGMARAKWLCEILERKDAVPESKSP
jgi:hypothetical protein